MARKVLYVFIALLLVSVAGIVLVNYIPEETTIEEEITRYESENGEITSIQIIQESSERSHSTRREVTIDDRDKIMELFDGATELVPNDRAPTVTYHLEVETTEQSIYTAPTILVSDATFAWGENRFHVNGENTLFEAIETGDFDWTTDEE
ncbi:MULTISPECIES: hypothetical protein [Shouchella]|uniref:LPS export ABC transporter periplasmic protein LptC n=2 Tax=Shouchella TaxID=2893057 RepID=A0ABY7W3C4_9BACI|nr:MULTISPECIES: hypothetical protein [Shouchella]MED4128827.1 hypothetical protein [Shouchella miscanthi]WDF01963.1 hypothetical protein PQ477_10545 [Shouchella hunanensis]GAF20394.1 hypothetical protein JCM19047_24 [Bacillus sp. JCM 19047]